MNHGQWLSNFLVSAGRCECFEPSRNNLFLRPKRKHTKWNNPMARRRSSSRRGWSSWGGGRGPKQIPKLKRFDENFDWKLELELESLKFGSLKNVANMFLLPPREEIRRQEVGELPQGPRESRGVKRGSGLKVVNKTKKGNAKRNPQNPLVAVAVAMAMVMEVAKEEA